TAVQATSRFDEIGGTVYYLDRSHRWNWGAVVDQTPYVSSAFQTGLTSVNGETQVLEREFRFVQTDRSLSGVVAYPFSRAQRVEMTAGVRQIGFSQDVIDRTFSPTTGVQLTEDRNTLSPFPALNLGQTTAALVYDTSIFGATSPIRGSRYRFEAS